MVPRFKGVARQPRQVGRFEVRSNRTVKTRMNYMEQFPVRIEVRLDEETRNQLQDKVVKLGVSTSAFIRMILKQNLNS